MSRSTFTYTALALLFISLISTVLSQSGQVIAFTAAEQQQILSIHNNLRFAVNAQSMPALQWNSAINMWPNNPNNCAFAHTTQTFRSNIDGFSYLGENLAYVGANVDLSTFMSGWASEKANFIYGPISLTNYENVGHYTQEVWSATTDVGCTKINCTQSAIGGFIVACNYGPGGNYLGQYPYLTCTSPPCATGQTAASPTASASRSVSFTSTATHTAAATPTPSPTCAPSTCTTGRCGNAPNGCGGALSCGSCPVSTSKCVNYQCVACTPTTTCSGKTCGTINDGCGNTVSCGTCASGYTCSNNLCTATPVCKTCSQLGYGCGTVTQSGCSGTTDCGTCSSGYTCSYGQCVATPCNPACGNKGTCVGGVCQCYSGYSNKGDGNGCTPIPETPTEFSQILPNRTSDWVYAPAETSTSVPELDMIGTDSSVQHKLLWNNAQNYASLELTKFTAQVQIFSLSTIVGLGLRYNQGSGRQTDALQYQLEPVTSNDSGNVRWYLIWSNNQLNYNVQGNKPSWTTNTWHTIQLNVWSANYSGITWTVSQVFVDGSQVTSQMAVRPYNVVGGAYLYTQGQSSWTNLTMATRTTLRVSVTNCVSTSAFQTMVANALGIPASSVTLVNVTDSAGRCVGQSVGKRQAGLATAGSQFIFSLNSVPEATSTALASQFTALAEEWNPFFAETGGILSVDTMPPEFIGTLEADPSQIGEFQDFTADTEVGTGATAGGDGLGAGAIAGIAVGSAVGGLIVLALVGAAVVGVVVFVVSRRRNAQTTVDRTVSVEEGRSVPAVSTSDIGTSAGVEERATPVSTPGRKGVDVYAQGDPESKRQSITGRIPSGYTPRNENVSI